MAGDSGNGDSGYTAHSSATVESGAVIGEGTQIWHYAHVRTGARIGADCVLGKDVFVDGDAVIGRGVRIQNGVSVYAGVHLEDEVFVGPSVVFTNDLYPRAGSSDWRRVETWVRRGASLGAGAIIVCGNEVGGSSLVAAGAVVVRAVLPHEIVGGNPAKRLGWICSCGAVRVEGAANQLTCTACNTDVSLPTQQNESPTAR